MAQRGQRQSGARRTAPRNQRRVRNLDNDGIMPVLARAVREVETAVQRGPVAPSMRTKFQVIALLVRETRAQVKTDESSGEAHRAEQLKRLDGVATILAKTAARDTSLLVLLAEDAVVSDSAKALKREMLTAAGFESAPEEVAPPEPTPAGPIKRQVVPQSVISRQLANPFLTPDFAAVEQNKVRARRLANWELLGPLLRSFEYASSGASGCMPLPEPTSLKAPGRPGADAAPGAGRRGGPGRAPDLPARRRAGSGQDRPGAARRADRERLPAARRRAQRRQDELGARGGAVDPEAHGHRHPRRRRHHRRLRRHRHRQLRGARPARRLARRPRLPRHGRRRGPLHQEQVLPALPARARAVRADPDPRRPSAADGTHRHAADQRHRGLPGDLAVPRLDRRQEAARRADERARGHRPDPRPTRASTRPPARR